MIVSGQDINCAEITLLVDEKIEHVTAKVPYLHCLFLLCNAPDIFVY